MLSQSLAHVGSRNPNQGASIDPLKVKATSVVGHLEPPKVVHHSEPTKLYPENWHDLIVDKHTVRVESEKGWFVMFMTQRCDECKKLEPVWQELHSTINHAAHIGTMDCQRTKVNQVCKDYKITKFPTLKFFPTNSDTMYTYTGETTSEAMHKFIDN